FVVKKSFSLSRHRKSARPWGSEKLYFRGEDYFKDILSAIRKARRTIDLEVYLFEAGVLGDEVIFALLQAARRGVAVRVLVDGIGSADFASHSWPEVAGPQIPFDVYRCG